MLPVRRMVSFNWTPIVFGGILAGLDVFMLGLIKTVSKDKIKLLKWMIIPTISYAITPWIFLTSLQFESMIVMNLMWDLLSDLLVTASGFLVFKEKIGPYKTLGVMCSLIAIVLMSIEDGKWEDFLPFK